jgi:hypothetical protein
LINGANDDEEDETTDRRRAEGEDRAGGAAGAGDGRRLGSALRDPSEPDLRLKKQLQDQAARAFDSGVGRDPETAHEREIERLHAKIGQLAVERDLYEGLSVTGICSLRQWRRPG